MGASGGMVMQFWFALVLIDTLELIGADEDTWSNLADVLSFCNIGRFEDESCCVGCCSGVWTTVGFC